MNAIELAAVVKIRGSGPGARRALDGVDLALDAGEIVMLEGPSGSGKTTLLSVAVGLLTPDAGEVRLCGRALGRLTRAERGDLRARSVGFVFQRANLLEALTVRENVLLAADLAGIERTEARRRSDRLLGLLGVDALSDRLPAGLSGGEEHRVAVARALVHEPAVVLADEPTGNLDRASGLAVAEALAGLARERGVAVMVATHDQRLRPYATRRLWIEDGRLSTPTEEET